MKYLGLIVFLLASAIASQPALSAGKVYTWTDSKGVVHYGERPPKDVKATLIKTRSGHSDPTPTPPTPAPVAAPDTVTTSEAPGEAAPQQTGSAKDPTQCEAARTNLATLNGYARIKTTDEKGETRYMSEEEKQQKRADMQKMIDQVCE